jgi:hypothetical protein
MANDPAPNPDPQNDPPANPPANDPPVPPANWDALLASLPDDIRDLTQTLHEADHESKVTGLKSALGKERDSASATAKQLRELAKTSEAVTAEALNKLAVEKDKLAAEKDAELETARKESTFYREAAAAGVSADKLARAWLLCRNADYFTKRGDPDIAAMKAEIPELFAAPQTTTQTNAGTGTRQQPAVKEDFNTNLRGVLKPQ